MFYIGILSSILGACVGVYLLFNDLFIHDSSITTIIGDLLITSGSILFAIMFIRTKKGVQE